MVAVNSGKCHRFLVLKSCDWHFKLVNYACWVIFHALTFSKLFFSKM